MPPRHLNDRDDLGLMYTQVYSVHVRPARSEVVIEIAKPHDPGEPVLRWNVGHLRFQGVSDIRVELAPFDDAREVYRSAVLPGADGPEWLRTTDSTRAYFLSIDMGNDTVTTWVAAESHCFELDPTPLTLDEADAAFPEAS